MVKEIDFHQIYYTDDQLSQIFPFAKPFKNETLTPFFENSVIAGLVPKSTAEFISVCSYALKHKMRTHNMAPRVELTEDHLKLDYDVLPFSKNSRGHLMLEAMDQWHKGSKELLKQICLAAGIPWVNEVQYPIYWNAHCTRSEIYNEYVETALKPAMGVMDGEFKEQCWSDSGYYKLKLPSSDFSQRVKHFLGVDYCPLHPFLLERLFSIWIDGKKLNVRYL